MPKPSVTPQDVKHISQLAQIPVTEQEEKSLAEDFAKTLKTVDELQELNVSDTPITHQVTGLENVWREDTIDTEKMFSQEEALANSDRTHNGYFVVNKVLEAKDT